MTATGSSCKKSKGRVSFPRRLFNLLKLAEENGWDDIISWVDDGKGFKVHNREKFETLLLAKYFKTPRYASFTRQLHAYDFDCIRTGRQTGIYSHPDFTRGNPEASCSLQRQASKSQARKAISSVSNSKNKIQVESSLPGIRAGDTIVQFPSLLRPSIIHDYERPLFATDKNSTRSTSVIAGLYNDIHSQVAEQTRKALIRIPSEAPDNRFNSPDPAFWSLSTASMQPKQRYGNMNTINDNAFDLIPLESEEEDGDDDISPFTHDLEPLPWSPEPSLPEDDQVLSIDGSSQLECILEPRPIQNMVQNPENRLNTEWWYDSAPMFDSPRKRAILEFSLPLSLPLGFYLMDVPKFGIYWATFLILGHFVECMFTAWGGAEDKRDKTYTKDFNMKSPAISMLQHHIMDLLWIHSLLSNMMLTPEYFGPSCFPLLYLFMLPQPINLSVAIKTHYCESNLEGTYAHEKYWIGDLTKNAYLGYALTMLGVSFMHVFEMNYLRVPLVFGFNIIPLFTFESYRYLLSMPATGISNAKKCN